MMNSRYSRHQRVIVSEENGAMMIARLMAVWSQGAIPCLLPPNMPVEKKNYCVHQVRASPVGETDDEAVVLFTSSTSGAFPKGVRLSHENLLAHTRMLRKHVPEPLFGKHDRTLAILPWTHCYGLMGECFSVMDRGASMDVLPRGGRFTLGGFLWGMHRTRPTVLFVVPRLLQVLAPYPAWVWGGHRLRYIVSGGACLDPSIRNIYENKQLPILQGYGMTEMSPMVTLQNTMGRIPNDIGSTLDGISVRIENGEILVNGPNRFLGYLGEDNLLPDGFHRTGDCGELRNGLLYLKGRQSEMIKLSNGRFMSLTDMEQNIKTMHHPFIHDICLWQTEEGTLQGVVVRTSDGKTSDMHDMHTTVHQTQIHLRIVHPPIASVEDGTLTLKGERARHTIRRKFFM